MIYGLYSKRVNPKESPTANDGIKAVRMKNLLKESIQLRAYLIQVAPRLAEMLEIFQEEHWKKDQISLRIHLQNASRKRSYQHLLNTILKLLYKIRCNLFHGKKELISDYQHQLLALCSEILERILTDSFEIFALEYSQ